VRKSVKRFLASSESGFGDKGLDALGRRRVAWIGIGAATLWNRQTAGLPESRGAGPQCSQLCRRPGDPNELPSRRHLRDGNRHEAGSGLLATCLSAKLDFNRTTPGSRDSCSLWMRSKSARSRAKTVTR
jgi:hypothetical protein